MILDFLSILSFQIRQELKELLVEEAITLIKKLYLIFPQSLNCMRETVIFKYQWSELLNTSEKVCATKKMISKK